MERPLRFSSPFLFFSDRTGVLALALKSICDFTYIIFSFFHFIFFLKTEATIGHSTTLLVEGQ